MASTAKLDSLIAQESKRTGVPVLLLRALSQQESTGGKNTADSPVGATGPFQIMPETAKGLGFTGTPEQLSDPATNTRLAADLIQKHLGRYGGNIADAIAAYYQGDAERGPNGGYRAPARTLNGSTYPSTDDYVHSVLGRMLGNSMTPDLNGTLSGNQVAAPTAPAGRDQVIDDAYQRLFDFVNTQKPTDYTSMFKPAQQAVAAQVMPKAPGPLQSFFATLGSPHNAPPVLEQKRREAGSAREQQQRDLLHLQEGLLQANIHEAVNDGDMKRALTQAKELAKLNAHLHVLDTQDEENRAIAKSNREHQNQLGEIAATGEQARLTAQSKAEEKAQKPTSILELSKMENFINTKFPGAKEEHTGTILGLPNPFSPKAIKLPPDRVDALRQLYITSLDSSPGVKKKAAQKLGLLTASQENLGSQIELIRRLKDMGITDEDALVDAVNGSGLPSPVPAATKAAGSTASLRK